MGESASHARLRMALLIWAEHEFGTDACAAALLDGPDTKPGCFPPNIGGYVPDMYLHVPGTNTHAIGEAKTIRDIETRHSREQYVTYLRHLALYQNSILVIAVPWEVVNQAKSLLWSIQKRNNISNVELVFLDKLPP